MRLRFKQNRVGVAGFLSFKGANRECEWGPAERTEARAGLGRGG